MKRLILTVAGAAMLAGCPPEDPEVFDQGIEPTQNCGRISYNQHALLSCTEEGAFDTVNGDPNPAEWIAGLEAPVVATPEDAVGEDLIEVSHSQQFVEGCGCKRSDGLPTGVFAHMSSASDQADLQRTGAGNRVSYVSTKRTLFGIAQSCNPNELCANERIELGHVGARLTNISTNGIVLGWSGLSPYARSSSSCDAPGFLESKRVSSTCSFHLTVSGSCHSRCDAAFALEAEELAAALEDVEGFDSDNLEHPSWEQKFREGTPLIANDFARLFRVSGVHLVTGERIPPLDESERNLEDHGLLGVASSLSEPAELTGLLASQLDLVETVPFCDEADCWWKRDDRPITTAEAGFLTLCQVETARDVERNHEDEDGDAVCDYWIEPHPLMPNGRRLDNCPNIQNPDQDDTDDDRVGDACDNCLHVKNNGQADTYGAVNNSACVLTEPGCIADEYGDHCGDVDGDTVLDYKDNCPLHVNPAADCDFDPSTPDEQCDFDGDGIGDACDDSDEDGVMDSEDSCRGLENPGAGQVDSDGDGVGDLCEPEFTFVSPRGDPTIEAEQSEHNEFVFDTNTPGVLVVPITVRLAWTEYDRKRDRLNIQIDDVGDSDCSISELTDPELWTAVESGVWEFQAQYICEQLPSRYDHFGLKNVSVRIDRRGVNNPIASSAQQKFEVFWPMLTDRALWPQRLVPEPAEWDDNNYARNHPGDWEREFNAPIPHACGQIFTEYREMQPPNWLYYWSQEQLVQSDYISDSKIIYATRVRHDQPCGDLYGWSDAGRHDRPRNMFFITDEALAYPLRVHPDPPAPPFRNTKFNQVHAVLFHEYMHRLSDFFWTDAIRDHPQDFDRFFEHFDGSEWSRGGERDFGAAPSDDEPYHRWRDLNGNGAADKELACDLNDDGNIGKVSEQQIDGFCGGAFVFQVDMNRDGLLNGYPESVVDELHPHYSPRGGDWVINENHPEVLDEDFDTLPDWLELPADVSIRDEELYNRSILHRDFDLIIDRTLERTIDWSDFSANHRP